MESRGDLERRDSISNLIERLTAELGPDGSGDGQYSPFGSASTGAAAAWQPAAPSPHPLYGGDRHQLHFGGPPPSPPYQADPVVAGAAAPDGELGTAHLSDNLAAHLAGFDTPLFDPLQPPPPPPPPGSFLSSWFGGWLGYSAPAPPVELTPPPVPHHPPERCSPARTAEPPPAPHSADPAAAPVVASITPPARQSPSPVHPIPPPAHQGVPSSHQNPSPTHHSPSPTHRSSPLAHQNPPAHQSPPAHQNPLTTHQTPPSPQNSPPVQQNPPPPPASAAPPSRPSYSAVLAKPAPATGPAPKPVDSAARQTASRGDAETPGGGGGGGGRRGGRGRRRRVSEAESKTTKEETTPQPAVSDGEPTPPGQVEQERDNEQKKAKSKKLTRTVSAGEVPGSASGRRSETLNNNPDRAQPTVQRRPLNYNNNLGASSTLGPAQTHVHTPPTAATSSDGDTAKKVDVNVGKQKNCGKTSNETKKVDITLNKPDNKTLSQSRGPPPVNLLSAGGGAKSERVAKELAFRGRGSGRSGGRGRRTADDPGAGGRGGQLLRKVRAQLAPGAALLAALVSWLLHLVLDVAAMSADLLWTAVRSGALSGRQWVAHWAAAGRAALSARLAAVRAWLARPGKGAASSGPQQGLQANIALPATGDEAMTRLLACKDSDPYSILGVTHDCSDADIKKYYRRQALLVHPDKSRSPGADEAFKILQRAFQLVGEPEKRAEFDSEAREKHEVNEAFRQYMDEMMTRLREKMEETQNTLRCNNCNRRHRRTRVDRPVYAARSCASCQIRHAAREGDIWAESRWLGLLWRYYACMDGGVFDISEWAACQSQSLKHLQANHHTVQYRIISGAKRHRPPADEPSDRDLEELLNNLCSGSMSGESGQQSRRRGARRRPQ
ncbi:DnaJ subfamily C member 14 [Amphibalanus amphitrite]|uniref:DnaJ subfamily C member 14 n=1 Tax=Amphibalanus amphitrite TaxID=1232801 RepID=A0A6A4WI24_AMPAM|nr:DnaJ subfamily C member 14 [Amphibalanus amphitrite]